MSLTKEEIAVELRKNEKNVFGDDKDKYDENLIEAVATKILNKNNTFTDEEKKLIDDFIAFNEENLSDNDSNTREVFKLLNGQEGGKKARKSRKVRKSRKERKSRKVRKERKSRKVRKSRKSSHKRK